MSIVEVAKLAGVSHATVSRVINRRSNVSSASVQRVQAAMRQLQYVPPAKRRGPKPKSSRIRTGNIGMLFFGQSPTLARSPIMAMVLHEAQASLASHGFNLTLGQLSQSGTLPPNVTHGHVDGLLLHGPPPSVGIREQLSRYAACVWLLSPRSTRGYWGDRVSPDDSQIGAIAADYLISRGHQSVAAIHCDPAHLGFASRITSFESAVRDAGVACLTLADDQAGRVSVEPSTLVEARCDALIDQLLGGDRLMPTGLFVPRDAITIRMYRALRARGIEPGRDIEIISCDNIPALDGLDPRPATIDVRPRELARRAVDQLLRRITQPQKEVSVSTTIEPLLIPGQDATVQQGHHRGGLVPAVR